MKKNLAFTLVEMLAIITLMAIISIISYVSISEMNKKAKEEEYEQFQKTYFLAAETYINLNAGEFEALNISNGIAYIKVDTFLEKGFLMEIPKNPKTDKIELNATIIIKKDGAGVLTFEYVDYDATI